MSVKRISFGLMILCISLFACSGGLLRLNPTPRTTGRLPEQTQAAGIQWGPFDVSGALENLLAKDSSLKAKYAGGYIREDGRLVVRFTDDVTLGLLEPYVALEKATFSKQAMEDAQAKLSHAIQAANRCDELKITGTYTDVRLNRLVVEMTTMDEAALRRVEDLVLTPGLLHFLLNDKYPIGITNACFGASRAVTNQTLTHPY